MTAERELPKEIRRVREVVSALEKYSSDRDVDVTEVSNAHKKLAGRGQGQIRRNETICLD